MDRRGLRRTKAAHINPVPLFVLAITLYVANLILQDVQVSWWNLVISSLIMLVSAFVVYQAQARFAENSTPIYFAIALFLACLNPNLVFFDIKILSVLAISLALFFFIRYVCEDKRKDYIANISFLGVIAAAVASSFFWFIPLFFFAIIWESDSKVKDAITFLVSTIISAAIIFGTLFLFTGLEESMVRVTEWWFEIFQQRSVELGSLSLIEGLAQGWASAGFANSITNILLIAGGLILLVLFLSVKAHQKSDDTMISTICFWLTAISIVLSLFFPEDVLTLNFLMAILMSVPVTHLCSTEGKHQFISIYFAIIFLIALAGLLPISSLL